MTMTATHPRPRIAMAGFFIECNRWSPVSTQDDFRAGTDIAGTALLEQVRSNFPALLPDMPAFVAEMDKLIPHWEPITLRMAGAQPGGPVDHCFFEAFLDDLEHRLLNAGRIDAVYLSMHGAALTTAIDDPDARVIALVRKITGPAIPIVAVFDLHANVSAAVAEALSALVAYRTNPHVDLAQRGQEAAAHIATLLDEGPGVVALVKLPLVPPAPSQLIAPGRPYYELLEISQQFLGDTILNVSLIGGFALADSPHGGFSICVSAKRADQSRAREVADTLAQKVWEQRHRFVTQLTPLPEAVQVAVQTGLDPKEPRLILADVADNPGGGGSGHTVGLLEALLEVGAHGVLLGVFTDPELAAQAHALGVNQRFRACFHRHATGVGFDRSLCADALVRALHHGDFLGRRGMIAGTRRSMGPTALLELTGPTGSILRVIVISIRQQLLDPAQLDIIGSDLSSVRTLVVKSRGHFRAAFDDFAIEDRILEVDCPGLTTPNLSTLEWQRLPRPSFPLDVHAQWP